jgi:hypothetical protein
MYVYFLCGQGDGKRRRGKDNDRIAVPELVIGDLFEDAFRPSSRWCRKYRVMIRLQKLACMLSIISCDENSRYASFHESFEDLNL